MKGPMFLSCFKRSRGQKQQYSCTCSSVDSNQFGTLSIQRSCDCELAWMVKRSESLKETTIKYTEKENLSSRNQKTNLHGSKSLPSTPLGRSVSTPQCLIRSQEPSDPKVGFQGSAYTERLELSICEEGEPVGSKSDPKIRICERSHLWDYPGVGFKGSHSERLELKISEEQETVRVDDCECADLSDGLEAARFHFTGEDTSLFKVNKENSLTTPRVSSESLPQEKCEDNNVEEQGNHFNESLNETEAFFFTGLDTSLHELSTRKPSPDSINLNSSENSPHIEKRVKTYEEVEKDSLAILQQNLFDDKHFGGVISYGMMESRVSKEMELRGENSAPVSLTTSFTGSMEESNPEPERPKSLYRELHRIGNMSVVQSKLMCWKALEEQYTITNQKHLLPYGCSEQPRRKNSEPCNKDDEICTEAMVKNDMGPRDTVDACVCNGTDRDIELSCDLQKDETVDIVKKEADNIEINPESDVSKEDSLLHEESCVNKKEGSLEISKDGLCDSSNQVSCDLQIEESLDLEKEGLCELPQEGAESCIVADESALIETPSMKEGGNYSSENGVESVIREETLSADAVNFSDEVDKSESLEDISQYDVKGDNPDLEVILLVKRLYL